MVSLTLPTPDGTTEHYTLKGTPVLAPSAGGERNRIAYAAAHVVADPFADNDPWLKPAIDWDRTIAYRRHLWDLGFGVAEAMDTAQRGGGLHWAESLELIRHALEAAGPEDKIACGCGTDHLDPAGAKTLDDVIAAYEHQIAAIEKLGGKLVLMASRALTKVAKGPEDYAKVYDRLLFQVREPVLIHWLGDMFDPALKGYWGSEDLDAAMQTCLSILGDHADKVEGIKISLLDDSKEIKMRRVLPKGVTMYTGDDFNYPALIKGDEKGFSHALLGIFDVIAPVAAAALDHLAAGDTAEYDRLFAPTVPLSRHIFKAPTNFYKTGVVFMAFLNGHQDHFTMIGGQESARSTQHLAELFRLADQAGLFADPAAAAARCAAVMAVRGIAQ
ncbi:dihydrodipicolinate synthase family protein [Sneathiella sp.]|uniref:dihydrodipicolinate synthase family protein n=1 Tax=Sneathiella sp. TaxID=1964365 RepID=UPI0035656933